MKRNAIVAALVAAAFLAGTLWTPRAAEAKDVVEVGDIEHGWIVWQGGSRFLFPFEDEWHGIPNPSGFTVENKKERVTIYFYGDMRVEELRR